MAKKKSKRVYLTDETFLKQIGDKIREKRLEQDHTIESLAHDAGLEYSQVSRMEHGKVNFGIAYIHKVAKALGIDPKELLPD